MQIISIIIISAFIGMVVGFGMGKGSNSTPVKTKTRKKGKNNIIEAQKEKSNERKKAILDFFEKNERITNNDIEKLLGVSDATAERYLNKLESEKKIKQIGKTGKAVFYRKIDN